jgi:CBS-domain-containing membrane protein
MKTQSSIPQTKVGQIMTRRVQTVMPEDTLQDAVTLMLDHDLTTVPVVNIQDKCVGVLSRSDLTEFFLREDRDLSATMNDRFSLESLIGRTETSDVMQVRELMTVDVSIIRENDCLAKACQKMVDKRVHHLPVVDNAGKIQGILSSFDIVAAVAAAE